MNRDHDILTILRWDDDFMITSKHYKAGVLTAFELAAESYENDRLLILIYDEEFHTVLRLYMETVVSGSQIDAYLYKDCWNPRNIIRHMNIAC